MAAYIRVSSRAQSYELQRQAVVRAATARGDQISAWFEEKASASTVERPELKRVRDAARSGSVRRLYVFRIDRLTRTGVRDTLKVVDELLSHGCELVTVADGFDMQGPAAEVVLAVMAWAAKMERLALGERIAAARERIEAAGGSWGRPRRAGPELVDRARQLSSRGRSTRQIAVALKIPRSTVQSMLTGKGPYAVGPFGGQKPRKVGRPRKHEPPLKNKHAFGPVE